MAGFPCQAFSVAGLKRGFDETRGTLFFDVARIAKEKQPDVIFLENVKGLKNHDKGKTFDVILNTLSDIGYTNVHHHVLNANKFGLSQNRERIFIVAFKNDNIKFTFPTPPCTPTKVGDILESDPDDKFTLKDRTWSCLQKHKEKHRIKGNGFGYTMVDSETEYTRTITSRYHKDGNECIVGQPNKNPRKITTREAMRLNGFPEHFEQPSDVSTTQMYKQMGNSVAVPVIQAIAENIFKSLQENE